MKRSIISTPHRARLIWALAFVLPLTLLLGLVLQPTRAAELPPLGIDDYVVEAFGPSFPITQGAWYSNAQNGQGSGYYYVQLAIPCGWPANRPVMIDLYSPEMSGSGAADELRTAPGLATTFELYGRNIKIGPGIGDPGPGAPGSLVQQSYPATNTPTSWKRLYTLPAPVQCGTYLVRAEAQGDNGNVWRIRAGFDLDNNPNNRTPANYDDPDGQAGTGDEIIIGALQTAFKHPQSPTNCLTLYEYVAPNTQRIAFHNFDMDTSGGILYYSPSGTAFTGTSSARGVWNTGTRTSRGTGDIITNPETGWWKIVTCAGSDRHFIQEGQEGVPAYFQQPPTPRVVVSKDDGLIDVHPNQVLDYTIQFTNTASMGPSPLSVPGAALQPVITDTLPANTLFESCAINAPYTGTCGQQGGAVVYTLNQKIAVGNGGSVRLRLRTTPNAPVGPVRNVVSLEYRDNLNNLFLASGNDIDKITPADLSLTKAVDNARPNVGEIVTFDVVVRNAGPATATNVVVSDPLPAGLEYVSIVPAQGSYNSLNGAWAVGALKVGASAQLQISARVLTPGTKVNTAQVAAADQPDPDSAPGNNNPREDDQASATVRPLVADLSLTKGVNNPSATEGDELIYTITVTNSGPDAATGVAVSDPLSGDVEYRSHTADAGSYNPNDGTWSIGALALGQRVRLTITVLILSADKVTNTAQVSASAQYDPDSTPGNNNPAEDDQASVTTPIAPTAVTLSLFTAQRQPGGVLVAWATASENNTWGFDIFRSEDGTREHATRINPELIAAQGRGQGGARYTFLDTGAPTDAPATYWLVESENGGATHEYGPVVAQPLGLLSGSQVFIPMASRDGNVVSE